MASKYKYFTFGRGFRLPVAVLVLAFSVLLTCVIQRRQETWEATVGSKLQKLLSMPKEKHQNTHQDQSWNDVPPVVQRYLHRVFHKHTNADEGTIPKLPVVPTQKQPTSVSFVQTGDFLLQDDLWSPYEAKETMTPHGFVWVARMSALEMAASTGSQKPSFLHSLYYDSHSMWSKWLKSYVEPFLSIWIVDAFCMGEPSYALISWMKGVKTVVDSTPPTPDFADQLQTGEAMRWLAEIVMLPSVYLPDSNRVRWKPHGDDEFKAVLVLTAANGETMKDPVQLTATFDPTSGFLTRVQGNRPYLERETKTFLIRSWVALFDDYQWSEQAEWWYPTTVQAGWMTEGAESTLSLAVRAKQTQVHYNYNYTTLTQ